MEENDEEADENKSKRDDENEITSEQTPSSTKEEEEEEDDDDDDKPSQRRSNSKEDDNKSFLKGLAEKNDETSIKEESEYLSQLNSGYEAGVSTVPNVAVTNGNTRYATFNCTAFLQKRNPFIHDPPQPEERRPRINNPRSPREYLINLREDLADFQESHGLPRTRDYSFLSLGLALAQETARALCSLFFMFVELFPILAIVSLILRFALDKLIEILETSETSEKVKKSIIFSLQMLMILIPLWIFVGTIILPLVALVFSIFKRIFRIQKGKSSKSAPAKAKPKDKVKKLSCYFQL